MQAKKNPTQQQFPLQVVKHCVLGVLNFKGQALKTHVLGAQAKYGWIPYPKTDRAKFMNEVLPKFYEAWYSKCKGAREFVKLFHGEGRCQYESHQRVLKLFSTADAILSNRNPGAKGKFFDEQYVRTYHETN